MTEAPDLVKRCYRLVVKLQHGPFLKLSKECDMRVLTSISVIVTCLWTAFVPVVLAQDERNENWFRVDIIQVIPDRLNDFIDLQVDDLIPAYKRAGGPFRSVWQTAEFGNTYERVFATPIASMADFDRGGPLAVASVSPPSSLSVSLSSPSPSLPLSAPSPPASPSLSLLSDAAPASAVGVGPVPPSGVSSRSPP